MKIRYITGIMDRLHLQAVLFYIRECKYNCIMCYTKKKRELYA